MTLSCKTYIPIPKDNFLCRGVIYYAPTTKTCEKTSWHRYKLSFLRMREFSLSCNRLILICIICSLIFIISLDALAGREEDFIFAQKLYTDGYYDLAAEQFADFIEKYPDDSRLSLAYFMRGKALFELEDWNQARAAFLRVALEFSQSKQAPEALYLSAHCQKNQQQWEDAARSFLSVNDYYPKSEFAAKGIVEAGIIYRLLGQNERAAAVFDRIVRTYPGTMSAAMSYFYLAEIAEENQDDNQALQYYLLAGKIAEKSDILAQTRIRRALIFYRQGDWDSAQYEIDQVQNPPEYLQYAYLIEGIWAQKSGDYTEAQKILTDILQNTKNDSIKFKAQCALADNYYLTSDYTTALLLTENLPPTDSLFLKLGLLYQALDSIDLAVEAFANAVKIEGDIEIDALALNHLKNIYAAGTSNLQISAVFSSYLPGLKNLPQWDNFALNLGIIAFRENNFQLSRGFLKQLEGIESPWSDDAAYYLARICELEGKTAEAIGLYSKFNSNFPGSDYAQEIQSRIEKLRDSIPAENLMEEIARLSAASMEFQNKSELALNWGKLYYEGFKDYSKACEQLKLALNPDGLPPHQKGMALGLLAKALLKISEKQPELADSARSTMKIYLRQNAHLEYAGYFNYLLLKHQVASIANTEQRNSAYIKGLEEILQKYPNDKIIPKILIELSNAYNQFPDGAEKTLSYSQFLLDKFPQSAFIQNALISKAGALLTLGDAEGAKAEYERYVQDYPQGFAMFNARLQLAELAFDRETKINLLKEITEDFYYHSQITEVMEQLGDLYSSAGQYDQALYYYLAVTEDYNYSLFSQNTSEIVYKIGLTYQLKGDPKEAQKHLLEYAVTNPQGRFWEQAIMTLAEISLDTEHMPAALKFYQNLISHSSDPSVIETALQRTADIYYKIGKYSDGREIYLQLADNSSGQDLKMEYSAQATIGLYRQGLLQTAREEAIAFGKQFKNSPVLEEYQAKFYLEKGKALTLEKNFNQAMKALEYIPKKYPQTAAVVEAQYEIGKIYLVTNHFEEALEILTKIPGDYPLHPILPAVYITLGTHYYRQAQLQNALYSFQKVLDDSSGRQYWQMAMKSLEMTYKDLGLYEAALSMVNKYLETYPYADDHLLKKLDAAQLLIQLREYDRAIVKLKELLPLAAEEMKVEVQFYIAEAYFEKGDFQQAVLEFMKVKYIDPGTGLDWTVTAIYNAGKCYEKLGQYDEALKMYQEIIDRWGANSDYGKGAQNRIEYLNQIK